MRKFYCTVAVAALLSTSCGGGSQDEPSTPKAPEQETGQSPVPTETSPSSPPAETSPPIVEQVPAATAALSGIKTVSGGYSSSARVELERPASMRLADNPDAIDVLTNCGTYDPASTAVLFKISVTAEDTSPGGFTWPGSQAGSLTLQSTDQTPQPQVRSVSGDCAGGNQISIPIGATTEGYVFVSRFYSPNAPEGDAAYLSTIRLRLAVGFSECSTSGGMLEIIDPTLCVAAVSG